MSQLRGKGEPMNDLISRQAAIDALGEEPEVRSDNDQYDQYDLGLNNQWWDDVNAIKALPSAQRKGKWIMHIDDLFPVESTKECSKCHHEQSLIIDDNFCPNCGADMRGEEDDK